MNSFRKLPMRKTFRIILEESLMDCWPGQRKSFRLIPESKENPSDGLLDSFDVRKGRENLFEGFLGN